MCGCDGGGDVVVIQALKWLKLGMRRKQKLIKLQFATKYERAFFIHLMSFIINDLYTLKDTFSFTIYSHPLPSRMPNRKSFKKFLSSEATREYPSSSTWIIKPKSWGKYDQYTSDEAK